MFDLIVLIVTHRTLVFDGAAIAQVFRHRSPVHPQAPSISILQLPHIDVLFRILLIGTQWRAWDSIRNRSHCLGRQHIDTRYLESNLASKYRN